MKIDMALIHSYPFTIRPLSEEDGGGFAIEYPDLPGCISDGETPEEALQQGADAVKAYLLNCMKHGDAVPKTSAASGQWQEGVSLNTLATTMIAKGLGRRAAVYANTSRITCPCTSVNRRCRPL